MNRETEFILRLSEVAKGVFHRDDIRFLRESTADDFAEWDSIAHMHLILATEREFGLRFTMAEIAKLKCVGDLLDILLARAGK